MVTDIEYTDEFGEWWSNLNSSEQDDIVAVVILLLTFHGIFFGSQAIAFLAILQA